MKFDMHCHTDEGSMDSKVPIEEFITLLKEKGFDGMLVSDHNSYNGYREWKNSIKGQKHTDFVVLKGIEYDTIDAGHILVIMPENVKLRILELRGLPVRMLIDIVHKNGGILGPAHPCGVRYLSFTNTIKKKHQLAVMDKFDFIEGFNACEDPESNEEAQQLAKQYCKPVFGGSDAHKPECVGMGEAHFSGEIRKESDLIKLIREKGAEASTCTGSYYLKTTRHKLGPVNNVLVQSFWFYNKFGSLAKRRRRKHELKKIYIRIK